VVDLSRIIKRITANEARAYLSNDWCEKLNEIYDGVRAVIETGANAYAFDVTEVGEFSKGLVLRELESDGYRLVQTAWNSNHYTIFW
jgi:hypothetical protein